MRFPSSRSVCAAALVGLAALVACSKDTTGPGPTVAAINIAAGTDTLATLGRTRQFSATASDASGHPVTATIVWHSSNPAVATVDSATGVATAVANGTVTITALAQGKSAQVQLTVSQVVAGIVVTPGSGGLSALGATAQFAATAKDSGNNTVAGVRFLWISSNPAAATIDTTGLATAHGPGQTTISASGRGIPGYATLTVTQTATQLAFTVQPTSAIAGEAVSPAVQVEIRDANGALVTGARDAVTIAIGTNAGGGTLAGTKIVNAVGGVATFSGLSFDKSGNGYTLGASAAGRAGAISGTFDITAAAAAKLAFSVQPGLDTAGQVLAPVQVAVQDGFGNTVTTATNTIHVTLASGPAGATLNGSATVDAIAGVATFPALMFTKADSGYRLGAGASALAGATSAPFTVTAGPAAKLGFVTQPNPSSHGADAITPAVQVAVQDSFGNTVTTATDVVGMALGTNSAGGRLSGTVFVNAVAGVATFADLSIDRPGDGYALITYTLAQPADTSAPFGVHLTFSQLSAGTQSTCALTTTGAAYCWGDGQYGQLGNGSTSLQPTPVLVSGGYRFQQIAVGYGHACGVVVGGDAYCWGYNSNGQLGDGTTNPDSFPVAVAGGHTFTSITTGAYHTCGLVGGYAYCWGYNYFGQLGNISTSDVWTPVAVAGPLFSSPLQYSQLRAGGYHTCGVSGGGAVCWGWGGYGQIGAGDTSWWTRPAGVLGGNFTFVAVAPGTFHTCAVQSDNTAKCWGGDGSGQLGDGSSSNQVSAVSLWGNPQFSQIASGAAHSCALQPVTGTAYCWGYNPYGDLGVAATAVADSVAGPVLGAPPFVAITGGDSHTCGLTAAGIAYCWGLNASGQLGNGSFARSQTPQRVAQ
ncbi:MAG TPA: Ig-like domain-containing protein [Gemmatimonadales bacterium]